MKPRIVALAAASLLAACGGGGDAPAAPTPVAQVPGEASQSVSRLVAWIASLRADDRAEPLGMGAFAPPRPDDAEPEELT